MTIEQARKIKINDIVICNTSFDHLPQKGWKGKVIYKNSNELNIGIEWGKDFYYGHDCDGLGKQNHCRFYYSQDFLDNDDVLILDMASNQLEFEF